MKKNDRIDISYFPGCSLATTAKENNQTLRAVSARMGFNLVELHDWNCCGSASAHSIHADLAFHLACRNLSLAPPGRPLLIACPSCSLRLRLAYEQLKTDREACRDYRSRWGREVDFELKIINFFEIMTQQRDSFPKPCKSLNGLKFAPYYGCMLARPPILNKLQPCGQPHSDLMERMLADCGAEPVSWSHSRKCCGTFLSAARPDVATPMVDRIMQNAVDAGAECLITACAMCHLNLEIRCSLRQPPPVFHFSEILSLAFDIPIRGEWFSRHLINPLPVLKYRNLLMVS